MPIFYDDKNRLFTLQTASSAYQFMVGAYGFLLHLYWGKRLDGDLSYLVEKRDRGFSGNPPEAGTDRTFSLDTLPLEYPAAGMGDFRLPAAAVLNEDGSSVFDPRFLSYEITKGKYALPGLPALYENEAGECETLSVCCLDAASKLEVKLLYGVFADKDILTRAVVFTNRGESKLKLTRAMTASIDFLDDNFDIVHFHGRHAMERNFERVPLMQGIQTIGSYRGASSHHHNPGAVLCEKTATEDTGSCYGFNLVYSGNFEINAEGSETGGARLNIGLHYPEFCWSLQKDESFCTPEAVLCYSSGGFSELSHRYHDIYRHNLCRGEYKLKARPILVNNWEATYFDFDGEKLISIAESAAPLGIELLVMDDGWFGERDNDSKALGDWFVNEKKLNLTLPRLSEEVRKRGLKLGIWFEPEMVSEDSALYRAHPDMALAVPGRKPVRGRNQLVLDMSREDVRAYLFEKISAVLDGAGISYVKWDMNRSVCGWYSRSLAAERQGELPHRHILGVYSLLEKLEKRYPEVLFEGCSGGGGRFDPGMLYYHPQIWCSDNTDAVNRLKIQYGTSFFYPIAAAGSHVSAVPNHQNGRSAPFATRCIAALSGTFGFELDLSKLSAEEKREAAFWTSEFKKHQPLIHGGRYYRLTSPFESQFCVWQFVDAAKDKALLCYAALDVEGSPRIFRLRLRGLDEKKTYSAKSGFLEGRRYSGAALMYAGIALPDGRGDYPAGIAYFEAE